ncbi:MAG: hypothetical protein ED557_14060 [Balneola sp.]|nr:MAG: hypothetical protein ED557_14060 [Balneola sp.]
MDSIILKIISFFLVSGYIYLSWGHSIKIIRCAYLSSKRKKLHLTFTWLIPYLWVLITKDFVFIEEPQTMTKKKRDELLDEESGHFYESRKGFPGARR